MDYEKALEKARAAYGTGAYDDATLEFLFPQLKESEDERIIGWLIGIVNGCKGLSFGDKVKLTRYLEKQKEQKPGTTKDNPINPFDTKLFQDGVKEGRRLEREDMLKEQKPMEYLDKDKVYAIMTKLINLSYSTRIPGNSDEYKKLDEITKDVRDLLVYPIEQKPVEDHYDLTEILVPPQLPQNPASGNSEKPNTQWSEEDERILKGIIGLVDHDQHYGVSNKEMLTWLKSLRPQPKQEWSEEDERMLERAIHIVAEYSDIDEKESEIVQNWLNKSLRPQPHWKPSEEELVALKRVGSILHDCGHSELAKKVFMIEEKLANLAVLNKSTWKPSEGQMKALNSIILTGSFTYVGQTQDLISLKDELKKL